MISSKSVCLLAALLGLTTHSKADTFTLAPNSADAQVQRSGAGVVTLGDAGDYQARIGEFNAPGGAAYVFPYQIPTLPAGQVFTAASLQFQLFTKVGTPFNADLYAVRTNANPTLLTTDYYQGVAADPNATLLQGGILTAASVVRTDANTGPFITSNAGASSSLASFLNNADLNNSLAGQYVFLRISYAADTIPGGNNAYSVLTNNAGGTNEKPFLTLTSAVPEPSTYLLMGVGGAGLLAFRRRRAQA